jgi:hypothetical protein
MRWRLALEVEFNSEELMDSKDWAREKAQQIRQQRERKQIEQKTRLAETEMKKAQGPRMWQQLRTLMKERVESLNQELGENALEWREVKSDEAEVRAAGRTTGVRLTFYADRDELEYQLPSSGGNRYRLKVPRDRIEWCDQSERPQSAESIVEELLEQVLRQL